MVSRDGSDLRDPIGPIAPITPDQTHAARLAVAAHATSLDDARMLLAALGLDRKEP